MDAPVQAAEAPLRRESALRRVGCKRLSVTSIFRPAAWALNAIQIYPSSYHSGGTRIASETVLMHPKPRTEKRKRQLESDAASSPITSKTYQRVNRAAASSKYFMLEESLTDTLQSDCIATQSQVKAYLHERVLVCKRLPDQHPQRLKKTAVASYCRLPRVIRTSSLLGQRGSYRPPTIAPRSITTNLGNGLEFHKIHPIN